MTQNIWTFFLENREEAKDFATVLCNDLMEKSGLKFQWTLEKTRDVRYEKDRNNLDILVHKISWKGGCPTFFSLDKMREFEKGLASIDEEHLLYKGHFSELSRSLDGGYSKKYESSWAKMFYFAEDGIHFQKTDVFKLHGIDWKEELKTWIHSRRGEFLIKDLGLE